jgi:hypothetical protein
LGAERGEITKIKKKNHTRNKKRSIDWSELSEQRLDVASMEHIETMICDWIYRAAPVARGLPDVACLKALTFHWLRQVYFFGLHQQHR